VKRQCKSAARHSFGKTKRKQENQGDYVDPAAQQGPIATHPAAGSARQFDRFSVGKLMKFAKFCEKNVQFTNLKTVTIR
jgi:hypothetical protein